MSHHYTHDRALALCEVTMRKTLFLPICAAVALTLGAVSPVSARSAFDDLVLPEQFYYRLAKCETNSNVNHSARSYTGMFGIYRRTWQRWSNSSSAKGKSARHQAKVVDKIAWHGHTEPDGEYVWPVGPWGWGAVKANCMNLQRFICKSKHPKVLRWKRRC